MSRFLLVRLGALGDIVHAIPVAAALSRAFPSARIDWLVSAKHRELLDLVPVIGRRLVIKDRGDAGGGTPLVTAIRELRRSRYDVAFDLQGLLKSAVLARLSGAQRVVGFSSSYLREPLARPFYTDVYDPGGGGMYDPRERSHVVQMNLGLLTAVGVTVAAPEFPIERVDTEIARAMRERAGNRYALVNPGAAWPNKRWPAARYGAVARAIDERHGLKTIVSWGPGEEPLAQEVVRESSGAALLSPRTSIADLLALIRGATLMISGDTGPTHIAAALGTPIVGIYGPTRPSRNGPWAPGDITISRDGVCQCHHLRRCTRDRMCLLDVEAAEVLDAVERRLAAV
ncbi:MAG: glycosyltransferase family 9 protein [Vicinamibacterales bacterium]|nr:glycosyltransferase family 9 protein [Vicinamibacterales bacterium]